MANEKRLIVAGRLLGTLLNLQFYIPAATSESEFTRTVKTLVSQAEGKHITVSDVADSVGYSISHTSALFRQKTEANL